MSKLVSIDLAIRQTGIAVFTNRHLDLTATIPQTLGKKYNPLDVQELKVAFLQPEGLSKYLDKKARIIIEYNTIINSHKLTDFALEVKGYLLGQGYDVVMINANHWMKAADKWLAIKRNTYPSGREHNKEWIKALVDHIFPNHKFMSQDEMDAALMGATYLVLPSAF